MSSKIHVHPEPENVTLFGNRVFAGIMYKDVVLPSGLASVSEDIQTYTKKENST